MSTTQNIDFGFFFEYNCGGCLWSDNDAAYQKFDVGVLDTDITDLQGNILIEARIKLPIEIKQKVLQIDKLYSESLERNNPGGPSTWNKIQWEDFYKKTRELHKEISLTLGDEFEIIYLQE